MSNISLASMTGTKVDSAAKHIVVCRVCTDFYSQFSNTCQELIEHASEYMVKRDEICLGIGRPFNTRGGFSHAENKAYIPVFSNSSIFSKNASTVANYYTKLYDARTEEVKPPCRFFDIWSSETFSQEVERISQMPAQVRGQLYYPSELFFAGVSLTEGHAHPHTGDTALSVMIGGMKTIKNGRFPVYAGDMVMWYFEFEADSNVFNADGTRKTNDILEVIPG